MLTRPSDALAWTEDKRSNWSRNIRFRPREVARPRGVVELKDVIARSERVKVVGSRHSFNDIADTPHTWLELGSLAPEIRIDPALGLATLPASMVLEDANRLLARHGLAFASLGEIDRQTLAGLIATGTHGTGLGAGTVSDSVAAVALVTGKGEYLELDSGEALAAARTHLGALGALASITFSVVPLRQLERNQRFLPLDEAADVQFLRSHAHAQFFYFPFADQVYVRTLDPTGRESSGWLGELFREAVAENFLLDRFLSSAARKPESVPELMGRLVSRLRPVNEVGRSYEMMVSRRTMRYHELEMAVHLEHLRPAFEEIRSIIGELSSRERETERFYAHMPVTVRVVKGFGGNLMSPTLGCDTAYLSVTSHTSFSGYERYFSEVESRLSARFGARPHWGKHYGLNPLPLYEGAPRFLAVRRELDPEGKFLNPYLARILS